MEAWSTYGGHNAKEKQLSLLQRSSAASNSLVFLESFPVQTVLRAPTIVNKELLNILRNVYVICQYIAVLNFIILFVCPAAYE